MKALQRLAVGIGLSLAVLTPAYVHAQAVDPNAPPPAERQGRGGRRALSLYRIPLSALDSVVTLTADEKTKITSILDTAKADIKAETDRTKHRAIETKASDDIKAALTTAQASTLQDELPSLTLLEQSHAIPLTALADVKLTSDQKAQIKTAAADTQEKIRAVPAADRQTQRPQLIADFKTKVEALLTADQKSVIAKATAPKAAV